MNRGDEKKSGWKQRLLHEMGEYAINVLYLALFFGVFTWYRRLILAEYGIGYLHYGAGVIQALVLAKIIMLGDVLGLGRKLEGKPLILPTLYKAIVFGLWVAVFSVLEHMVTGLVREEGLTGGLHELRSEGAYEVLGRSLVTFFAFIPFFAFREAARVLGEGRIWALFFRRRSKLDYRG